MTESIASTIRLREEAQEAFKKGLGVSDCPYPWHTSRAIVWVDEMKTLLKNKDEMCSAIPLFLESYHAEESRKI